MKKLLVPIWLAVIAACGGVSSSRDDQRAAGSSGAGGSGDTGGLGGLGGLGGTENGGGSTVAGGAPAWVTSPDQRPPSPSSAGHGGVAGSDYAITPNSIAVAPSGAVVVAATTRRGPMEMTPACDPGFNGVYSSAGGVLFYDSAGTLLRCVSLASGSEDAVNAVALDAEGNVNLAGSLGGPGLLGSTQLPSAGSLDAVVAQLDPAGNVRWFTTLGYEEDQEALGLAVDAQSNLIVAGDFEGTIIGGADVLNAVGSRSAFLIKLDPSGAWKWGRSFGGGWAIAQSVAALPDGTVIVYGKYDGPLDLGSAHYVSQGAHDIFLAAYDSQGAVLWSKVFGNSSAQAPTRIAADGAGSFAITGRSQGEIDFGGGGLDTSTDAVYIASFGPDGTHRWSRQYAVGGEADATPSLTSIAFDASGNVIVAGAFLGQVDFGTGVIKSETDTNVFVAAWSASGEPIWSYAYGWDGPQAARALAYDPKGGLAMAGIYKQSLDMGAGTMNAWSGIGAMFVVRYPPW